MEPCGSSFRYRILIVDDEERIVESLASSLSQLDAYEVHAYTSGQAAREALLQGHFDLLISDWKMPDLDGLTLILEAKELLPDIQTVLTTAYGSTEVQARAESAEVDHYLEKPFDIDDLLQIIESVLPSRPSPAVVSKIPVFKVILGGDGNVGKTSLIQRYCTGQFDPIRLMTIGIDFHIYDVEVHEHTPARLVVWDLGGQDRFSIIRDGFYRGSHAVGLVFDASNRNSFYNLMRWWREVRQHLHNIPLVLLANKIDLPRQVSEEETRELANAWGIPFYESSCATGVGVPEFFHALAHQAWEGNQKTEPTPS